MSSIRLFIASEPVLVRAVIVIAVAVAARHGFDWDTDAIFNGVLILMGVGAVDARRKVTPA